jgi:hypothetical protein
MAAELGVDAHRLNTMMDSLARVPGSGGISMRGHRRRPARRRV